MNLLQATLLGIVEGITEFLPVSSTGHMILAAKLLRMAQTDFVSSFEIAIQLGAILAVVILYARTVILNREIAKRLLAAFIPTAILGAVFYKIIKHVLLKSANVVAWSLLLGGIVIVIFELLYKEKESAVKELGRISYGQSVAIGAFQSIAMVPGVSRAAATIIGGLSVGVSRRAIVEFSFLLAVPTMAAAAGLDLLKSSTPFTMDQWGLFAVGFVTSFIVAMAAVRWFLRFIQNHGFIAFGVYRIIVGAAFLFLIR
jgi:undecaprenyl-diphosphatase